MMDHEIPEVNWAQKLAGIVSYAVSGDTVLCHSNAQAELGERARKRLCPSKVLTFRVVKEER